MQSIKDLEPNLVFDWFEKISLIPRGSGNEKAVSDYIVAWCKEKGFDVVQDENNNIVVRKNGTNGYENSPVIMLQGHLDMVCEKNKDTKHDFTKDPLDLYIDGDFIKARGTTLGGDNGIAVAYGMALLESTDITHPPLEIIFTTEEETGLFGAKALSGSLLSGKTFINIDTEDEGVFCSSCAGGLRARLSFGIDYVDVANGYDSYLISITGLQGGHSGTNIIDERGNSNIILARVLNDCNNKYDMYIANISGGAKDNAIPREAETTVFINNEQVNHLTRNLEEVADKIKKEFIMSDNGLKINIEKINGRNNKVFTKESATKIISAILLMPNGILHMSTNILGLPETSCNLGVVSTIDKEVRLTSSVRSSVISRKYYLVEKIQTIANVLGGKLVCVGDYPAWEYNLNSEVRKLFIDTYRDLYQKEPKIEAIHAGLECGLFAEKVEGIDMISFGPDVFGAHTPEERMSIPSVIRCWEFLLEILKRLK